MTPIKFVYEVFSLIQLTGAELALLRNLFLKHYDRNTRDFFTQFPNDITCQKSPGLGWCNQFYFWTKTEPENNPTGVVEIKVSARELDLCCYVLSTMAWQIGTQDQALLLLHELGPQLRMMNAEYLRLNPRELVVSPP